MGVAGGIGSQTYNQGVQLTHGSLDIYNKQAGKRTSATQGSDGFSFMLTKVEDGKQKGVGLLGINLANVPAEPCTPMPARPP